MPSEINEQAEPMEPLIVGDWNLTEAREYVTFHAIDNEDFLDNDQTNQVRFLNVAKRTLSSAYKGYTIPNEAVYLFACVLNANFNDTTVYAQRGVASFGVEGISFTFKDWAKKELAELIPKDVAGMIAEANPELNSGASGINTKWVVL